MLRWRLKACPRCQGDVYIDKDADGWFEQCLQCSCRREFREIGLFQRDAVGVGSTREDWSKDADY